MVKLSLDLREPSMTFLHRAGVAGLFVQLKYLEQLDVKIPHVLKWSLTAHTIELDWTGNDRAALQWLCDQTFQLDTDGLIYFPAIANSLNFRQRLDLQNNLRKTFLQHNQFFKSGDTVEKDDRGKKLKYVTCRSYGYQKGAGYLCGKGRNKDRLQSKCIKITGWIYPGATVKHSTLVTATQFAETPTNFFALLFAPLACSYVRISPNFDAEAKVQKFQTGVVIPEVTNLEDYQQDISTSARTAINYRAAGWAEAGLKFLLQTTPVKQSNQPELLRCLVISFGVVEWSKQQHTRVAVEPIAIDTQNLERYQIFARLLDSQDSFPNPLLQFIAENLIRGRPWWWNFAEVWIDKKADLAITSHQQ